MDFAKLRTCMGLSLKAKTCSSQIVQMYCTLSFCSWTRIKSPKSKLTSLSLFVLKLFVSQPGNLVSCRGPAMLVCFPVFRGNLFAVVLSNNLVASFFGIWKSRTSKSGITFPVMEAEVTKSSRPFVSDTETSDVSLPLFMSGYRSQSDSLTGGALSVRADSQENSQDSGEKCHDPRKG